jgi:hypothetical protein
VLEEVRENLETLMREFAQDLIYQELDDLGRDDPVLLLIIQGLCHQICRSDLFCPDPNCEKEIKKNLGLLKHPNKKHELTGTCCKDLMRYFLEDLYSVTIHIKLMTGNGENADRQ